MKNNFVTILDFGSSKITCMAASKVSDKGDFVIKAVGQSAYNGFDESGWYEPDTIKDAVNQAINQVEAKMQKKVKEIFVGIPAAFCAVVTGEASVTFHSKKKIDNDDIAEVVRKADIFDCGTEYVPLRGKPVYFVLDGAIKTTEPVGHIASKLMCLVSFSYMKSSFRNSVMAILGERGIGKITYVNACEAQANYVVQSGAFGAYTIIIDIGHITSTVALCGGNGLLFQKCFALGSGYIASDLCKVIGCDFNFAMSILEKVNLNLDIQSGDAYSINGRMIDASNTNGVIKARIANIAQYVIKSFRHCDRDIPANTPIVLTGGGLAYIRGGVDCLEQNLCKQVRLYDSVNPQTKRNEYTSCYGVLSEAVRADDGKKSGIFSLFKKIGKRR